MRRIYLDHTATTPLDPRVMEAMLPFFSETFGNASSIHGFGREAKSALEQARDTIARCIGAESGELFFTSGGTEADNFAIRGTAIAAGARGKSHLVTSAAEHHAVLEPCEALATEGFKVTTLEVDEYGAVTPDALRDALTSSTSLVSIMHANNEVGTISAIADLASAAHASGAIFHTDAVQTLGKLPLNVNDIGVDLMTISAHKVYGPKGIGALYVRRGTQIDPLFHGGGQERGKRPGTENVPLAVGFARAVQISVSEMRDEAGRLMKLRDELEQRIRAEYPAVIVNGHPVDRLPHILSVSFDSAKIQLEGEMLVVNMDLRGIAVSSGSACTSGSIQPSHVLLAMGRDARTAKATIRFSFGKRNTPDDVGAAVDALGDVLKQMTGRR